MAALRTAALGAAGQLSLGSLFVRLTLDAASFNRGWAGAQSTVTGSAATMTRAVAGMSAAAGLALVAVGVLGVREAAKFEQSFAQVRRTVEATQNQFDSMSKQFRQMAKEMPVNVNEINRTAAAAGALGIPTKDIVEFTKVMIDMGATTNMSADQAATAMGRIANIMGNSGADFGRMGSTILKLGVSTASTESEISSMGVRLAGTGKTMRMTTAEVLGLAASLSSVGVRAEVGGTAMAQVMQIMTDASFEGGEALDGLARIANTSMTSFADTIKHNAMGAILQFFEGLQRIYKEGGNVGEALNQIGIDGERVKLHLLQAAGAAEKLSGWVRIGTDAWTENTARAQATAEIYGTFISQLKILGGHIREFFISVGEKLIPALKTLVKMLMESMESSEGLGAVLQWFVNNVAPAFIYVIKQIGDFIYKWQLVIKTGETAFLGLASIILGVFTKVNQGIADHMASIINGIGAGIDVAIRGINLLLPKAAKLSELKLDVKATLPASLNIATQATKEAFEQSKAELKAMVAKGLFSERFEAEYTKVTSTVKQENQKIIDDIKKTTDIVADQIGFMTYGLGAKKEEYNPFGAMKEVKSGAGDFMKGPGQSDVLKQFEDPMMRDAMMLEQEKQAAKEGLEFAQSISDLELDMLGATQEEKLKMIEAYNERVKALQMAEAQLVFQTSSKMFDDLASISKAFAGEQSGIYKGMFAISKAFAIADAIIKIQQGIAGAAAAQPFFPVGLAAMAGVVSATAGIISTMQSVKLEFAGKREAGGPVSAGRSFLVGEAGPEMFVPNSAGSIIPNDEMGGRVKVVVNNYTDAKAEVSEHQEGNERVIEIVIRRTKSEIASEVRDGRGDVTRAMESSFGLKRGKT